MVIQDYPTQKEQELISKLAKKNWIYLPLKHVKIDYVVKKST